MRLPVTAGRAPPGEGSVSRLDEVAERAQRRRVVGVVDDDAVAVELEHVHAARRHVVRRREGPQALADVVEMGAGGPRGGGRGQRVLDVHPRAALERGRDQMGPHQRHRLAALAQDDHLAVAALLQRDCAAAAGGLELQALVLRIGAEVDDRSRAVARHGGHQRVIGVEHGDPVAGHGLDDDALDLGQLADRVDAAEAEVVAGHVDHDGDVVAVVAEALAQDAAAGDLEHGEVDGRVLEHHRGGLRPRRVRLRTTRPST